MREIRVLSQGFRLIFTAPVDPKTAADPASYLAEHYRYEYTGSYGATSLWFIGAVGKKIAGGIEEVDLLRREHR